MSDFFAVAKLSDIPDPGQTLVEIEDRLVVVFHVDGKIYCLDDICTHDGGTLGDGQLDGNTIACPRHGAKFDIRNGDALTMPATKATVAHETKIEGNDIFVKVNDGSANEVVAESSATSSSPSSAAATAQTETVNEASIGAPNPATATVSAPGTGLSEDRVREELKKVIDPELFVNIVDLGLIYVVDLNKRPDGKTDVCIDMTMTSPACPAGPQLIANSKNVVSQLEEVETVEIKIVMDPPWTPDRMTDDARDQLGIF